MEEALSSTSFTYTRKDDHSLQILLNRDRQFLQAFCDVTISVDINKLRAHRVILAAHSDYFKKRLKNNVNTDLHAGYVLEIDGLNWMIVKSIVDFIYTSDITVTSENVYELVAAADYFQMPEVKKFCIEFLETFLCSDNCLKILEFARSRTIEHLMEKATHFIYNNFEYVIKSMYFKRLNLHELREVIRPDEISHPLKICESLIFEAVVTWTNENTYRRKHFADLFNFVALNRLKLVYLTNHVAKEELVKSSLPCLQSVLEAIQTHCSTTPGNEGPLTDQEVVCILIQQRNLFKEYFMNDDPYGIWFVICTKWLNAWVKYVTNDGYDWTTQMKLPPHPGPIDNSSLFTNRNFRMLKTTIKAQNDYKFITESAWWALVEWYGTVKGQPPISEKGLVTKEKGMLGITDKILLVDPVELQLCMKDKTVKKTFSQWDLMSEVEEKVRVVFGIPAADRVVLQSDFKKLDLLKTIKETKSTDAKIVITTKRDGKLEKENKVNSSTKSKGSVSGNTTTKGVRKTLFTSSPSLDFLRKYMG